MIEPQLDNDLAPASFELAPPVNAALPLPLADDVLACMSFGVRDTPTPALSRAQREEDARILHVPLQVYGGEAHSDVWISHLPVRTGVSEAIRHADNGEILFGWLQLPESELQNVERAAYEAHSRIYRVLNGLGFPHGLRVWNYLSSINDGAGDAERYRQFTTGRYEALTRTPQFERLLPAATAIGTHGATGLTIGFFAGKTPGLQVENPRQTSAFEYPRLYGPRSPSFSRATLQRWRDRSFLFVSGTASIVGHATTHPGDAAAQFEETLRNLDALLEHAARRHFPGHGREHFHPRAFKLYLRDPKWLSSLEPRWRTELAARAPTTLLIGDLCRRDLLLEIEAVYSTET